MSIVNEIEPTNIYVNYVKDCLKGKTPPTKILWVYGNGNNGKTTLIKGTMLAFPNKIIRIRSMIATELKGKIASDILNRYHNGDEYVILSEDNKIMGSIFEINEKPHQDIVCTSVELKNTFKLDCNMEKQYVECVKNEIKTLMA